MTSNPETCSNCGTENRPGADFCAECGQPLSQSAEGEVREQMEAQEHGGAIGGDDEVPPAHIGFGGLDSPRMLGVDGDDGGDPSRRRTGV